MYLYWFASCQHNGLRFLLVNRLPLNESKYNKRITFQKSFVNPLNPVMIKIKGDAILSQISNLLGEHTPSNAVVGRYGGEEFMLLIPETNVSYVERLAEDIRLSCATVAFLSVMKSTSM